MAKQVAIRDAIGNGLVELGKENDRIMVLDADLSKSTKVDMFAEAFPDRFIQVGIAEQNMMGIAAGLASFGFIPFTSTFACFAAKRACDQIRIVVAQPRLNVKIIGAYAGLFTGKTGATHQSVQDAAIMRAMPNMVVVEPCDAVEAGQILRAITAYEGPVYLRGTRDPIPVILDDSYRFEMGRAWTLREGKDVLLIGSGYTTHVILEAAGKLAGESIDCTVINCSSLKPFDNEAICEAAAKVDLVVTVENHSIIGGLGSAVTEVLAECCPTHVKRLGIMDCFGESGSNEELARKYGLDVPSVVQEVKAALESLTK